ncbi:MAG: NUDIX domain-containing protein, partial [Candidatus Latescibacteria bacterium]|nr:NUDIX domain-containing protein [bacterium]MBD3423281.1 NUDIX domain-containing protein [Candidatus Latescibacterota bacterium]
MNEVMKYCPYCAEPLSLRENEGRKRLYCTAEQKYIYRNPIPAATGLILDGENRILLVLRAREPGKNEWGLPGGFVETDESPIEAARRELMEETGLTVLKPELINVVYQESDFYNTTIIIIGYRFLEYTGDIVAGDDAAEAR